MARLEIAVALRPLLARLPRGWGAAYRWILGPVGSTYRGDDFFKAHLRRRHRVFYDRHLRCRVLADLGDAGSRSHYILGRYYDTLVPLLIRRVLGPADTFVDVGANRGVHTLFAARHLVEGRVVAYAPNPQTCEILRTHLSLNGLRNVEAHNLGLGDRDGTLDLQLFGDDAPSGCSFIDKGESAVKQVFSVPVRRLDELLPRELFAGRTLVKIDTEGFDHNVVRGMGALLDHERLVISAEFQDAWLRRAGSSAAALFEDLVGRGFRAYLPRLTFRGVRETLCLEPISRAPDRDGQYDLVFGKPGTLTGP